MSLHPVACIPAPPERNPGTLQCRGCLVYDVRVVVYRVITNCFVVLPLPALTVTKYTPEGSSLGSSTSRLCVPACMLYCATGRSTKSPLELKSSMLILA